MKLHVADSFPHNFGAALWRKFWSKNSHEQLKKDIKRSNVTRKRSQKLQTPFVKIYFLGRPPRPRWIRHCKAKLNVPQKRELYFQLVYIFYSSVQNLFTMMA